MNTTQELIRTVSRMYHLKPAEIFTKARDRELVEPRHMIFAIIKAADPKISNNWIGTKLLQPYKMRLTSASIVNARRKTAEYYLTNALFRDKVNLVLTYVYQDRQAEIAKELQLPAEPGDMQERYFDMFYTKTNRR